MYYYVYNINCVEKFSVTFSKKKLEELKLEIINNCSEIEHHEYEGTDGPNYFDYLKIRNYNEKFVKVQESRDSLQWPDKKVYLYSYDEYKYPSLVYMIDELLKGKIDVLDNLLSNDLDIGDTIDERINKASNELDLIDNLDISNKRTKLDELQKLSELKRLNKNQMSVIPYFVKLLSLIKLELVDTISLEELNRVSTFFENPDVIKKVLKR